MAEGDIITLAYAKTIANIPSANTASDVRIAALITACSLEASNYCGRKFTPGYYDELYNGSGIGYIVLRQSPLLKLSQVIIGPSTSNPQTYDGTNFDIDPVISKMAFKPSVVADFFYGYTTNLAFPSGINTTEAQYFAGYGDIVTVAATTATGSQTVTPSAMFGLNPNGNAWSIANGSTLIVDSGLQTQEIVTVTGVSSTTFTATFTRPHAAAYSILIPVFPADLQGAIGIMVSNLYRQIDFTKQSETLGQYSYSLRPNLRGAMLTDEVLGILNRYKSQFSG